MQHNKIIKVVFIPIVLLLLSGCINEQPNVVSSELTDKDWDYFVFHYTSGRDLYGLYKDGFDILNTELSMFDPTNSSFLLECNASNIDIFSRLKIISDTMNTNLSFYKYEIAGFNLSDQMKDHGLQQSKLLDVYVNLSNVFFSVYKKVETSFNASNNESLLIDISNEMNLLFASDEIISLLMDDQIASIIDISDEVWAEWTKNRDWSFMD